MRRILFLDIDGVLNADDTTDRIGPFVGLCDKRIALLNTVFDRFPDVEVVMSSTWRHGYHVASTSKPFDAVCQLLRDRGFKGNIVSRTPSFFSYIPRGQEIRHWLIDHLDFFDLENFPHKLCVLDDDASGMSMAGLSKVFVRTEASQGLTSNDVKRIIELLE